MFMLFDDKVEADSVQKTGILTTQSRCYKINRPAQIWAGLFIYSIVKSILLISSLLVPLFKNNS